MCGKARFVLFGLVCIGLLVCGGVLESQDQTDEKSVSVKKRQHNYYFALYRPGPNWVKGKTIFEQPKIKEHGQFMGRLQMKGEIVLGGPFTDNSGGFALFDFADAGTAIERIRKDPIVQSNVMSLDVRPWFPTIPGPLDWDPARRPKIQRPKSVNEND